MKILNVANQNTRACACFMYKGYEISASSIMNKRGLVDSIIVCEGDAILKEGFNSIEQAIEWVNEENEIGWKFESPKKYEYSSFEGSRIVGVASLGYKVAIKMVNGKIKTYQLYEDLEGCSPDYILCCIQNEEGVVVSRYLNYN